MKVKPEYIIDYFIYLVEIVLFLYLSEIIYDILWWYFEKDVVRNLIFSKIETTAFFIFSTFFFVLALAISMFIVTLYYSLMNYFVENEIRNNIKYK